jgi:AcrR family transcriptional regulator
MADENATSRRYRSAVRTAHARRTRLAVINAAAQLFTAHGYGLTTIAMIAAEAGVGRATIFKAVGGKPALMCAAHHLAIAGTDDLRPPHETGLMQRWADLSNSAPLLEAYVDVVTDVFESVGPIHEAMVRAASEANELRDRVAIFDDERHQAALRTARLLAGELRSGLTVARAADILWVHNDPLLWQSLHARRGWSRSEFGEWLTHALSTQLLA